MKASGYSQFNKRLRDFLKADVSRAQDNNGAAAMSPIPRTKQLLLGYGAGEFWRECSQLSKAADGKRFPPTNQFNLFEIRAARWLMKITLVMKLLDRKMRKKVGDNLSYGYKNT